MRTLLAALLLLAPAAAAVAQQAADKLPGLDDLPPPPRYIAGYVLAGGGVSLPFGGHWGDASSGFKPSPLYLLSASKRIDETLSYGLETSYASGYGQRQLRSMDVRIFSLTPFLKASFPDDDRIFYGILGAGVYQWTQPELSSSVRKYPSSSGSSGGINLGGGVTYPFWWGTRAGLDLRWHHIFDMKGANFSLGAVDNFCAALVMQWSVWKDNPKQ
jgi:hypothetical protein